MKEPLDEAKENTFVPWLDSALLPEESEYSVVNKVAWFLAMPPIAFLRACKLPKQEVKDVPFTLDLHVKKHSCEQYLTNERMTPVIYGKPMNAYLAQVSRISREERVGGWNAEGLRVCPDCIAMGVHLNIHQHLAIDQCPVHQVGLQTDCPHCAKPLPANWQGKQPAFCCEHCRVSLLTEDRIVMHHSADFRQSVAAATGQFNEWRTRALLDQRLKCGAGWGKTDDSEWEPWSERAIQLSAGVQSVSTPAWVRRSCDEGIDIRFKTLDLNCNLGRALTRGIAGDVPSTIEKLRNASPEKSPDNAVGIDIPYLCRGRFRSALRRVTSIFLSRYTPLHPDCLNTPHHMFGQRISWNNTPGDILFCCPVAVGFWMWRTSSADTYRDMANRMMDFQFTRAREANIDLLLYALARSHLHYCIALAKHCIDKASAPGSCRLDEAINPIEEAMRGASWSPIWFHGPKTRGPHFDIAGRAYYVHVDITNVLANIPCAGRQALDDRINARLEPMRQLRESTRLKRGDAPLPLPEQALKYRQTETVRPPQPFKPTSNDYLFVSHAAEQGEHEEDSQLRWFLQAIGKDKQKPVDQQAVLHSSINSKHDRSGQKSRFKRRRI